MTVVSICFLLFLKISDSFTGFFISVFLHFYFCVVVVLFTFYLVTNSFPIQVSKIFVYNRNVKGKRAFQIVFCSHGDNWFFFFSLEVCQPEGHVLYVCSCIPSQASPEPLPHSRQHPWFSFPYREMYTGHGCPGHWQDLNPRAEDCWCTKGLTCYASLQRWGENSAGENSYLLHGRAGPELRALDSLPKFIFI